MEKRLESLRARMKEENCQAYLVRRVSDLHWLTGFSQVFDSEAAHLALITPEGAWLHSDSRYSAALRARNTQGLWEISDEAVAPYAWVSSLINSQNIQGALGLEQDLPLMCYRSLQKHLEEDAVNNLELLELESPIQKLRACKDEAELKILQQAQDITDETYQYMLNILKVGMTEKRARFELETHMRRLGADDPSFTTIIASGANGANPHAVASDKELQKGDMIVMDFGAKLDGYCADMTRTVALGEPGEEARLVYQTVLDAHRSCKEMIKPGVPLADVHNKAAEIIAKGGYSGHFNHSLGHGVGLDVHEAPTMSPLAKGTLELGNVVTVEPGIYLEGKLGVRIENCGVVESHGYRSFTASSDELVVL